VTISSHYTRVLVVGALAHSRHINNGFMKSNWFRGSPDTLYVLCKPREGEELHYE
jgi:hypothetical protein